MTCTSAIRFDALPLLSLRLALRFDGPCPARAHAAELWRGVIKGALGEDAPDVLALLQGAGPPGDPTRAKPTNVKPVGYVLRLTEPMADSERTAQDVGVTLFGHAASAAWPLLAVLLKAGARGVGQRGQIRFTVERMQRYVPAEGWVATRLPAVPDPQGFARWAWVYRPDLLRLPTGDGPHGIALALGSRLHLQVGGQLVRAAPPLALIVQRLIERANTLAAFWGAGQAVAPEVAAALTDAAAGARLLQPEGVRLVRRNRGYPTHGLAGTLLYALPGDALRTVAPLLDWGRWLHVGNDSSMGLGHYELLLPA